MHFDAHFPRIKHVHFMSKDGKDAACKEGDGWKGVYFPPK